MSFLAGLFLGAIVGFIGGVVVMIAGRRKEVKMGCTTCNNIWNIKP